MSEINFHSKLEDNAKDVPDSIFLKFGQERITFLEMNRRANRIANSLLELGAKPGQGAAIMLANSPEFLDAFFACQKISVYAVPVNTGLKGQGLAHILSHSEARFLVIHQDYPSGPGNDAVVFTGVIGDGAGTLGKPNDKLGTFSRFALDFDVSAHVFDYTVYHRKTEPRALTLFLGREEGGENLIQGFAVHTHSGIVYSHFDIGRGQVR